MINFIVYCIWCMVTVISCGFGNIHDELTFKDGLVGVITMFVSVGILYLIIRVFPLIFNKKK